MGAVTLLDQAFLRDGLLSSSLFFVLRAVCNLSLPICVYFFIQWCERVDFLHRSASQATAQEVYSSTAGGSGLVSAIALGASSILSYYFEASYMLRAAQTGLQLRERLAACVFSTMLRRRLCEGSLNSGEVHNLHGVDTVALEHAPDAVVTLLLQPIEILCIVALLIWFVGGPASAAALGAVLLNMGAVVSAGLHVRTLDAKRTAAADARVRTLAEFLSGMRAVKLMGWEAAFGSKIKRARDAESALYGSAAPLTALINVVSSNGIDLISVALLMVYHYAQGLLVSSSMIFTYWVLLAALHGRMFHLPIAITEAREALGAWGRLQAFLNAATSGPVSGAPRAGPAPPPGSALAFRRASLSWTTASQPVLENITVAIGEGQCAALVGPVASGKTSLLLSILGELHISPSDSGSSGGGGECFSCSPLAREGLAYVPQSPWTLPTTVRANILLGRPFEPAHYSAVVQACCLEQDFRDWPQGDLSNTSSTILSGGQRARVALARAAYGRPTLFLADDPFSALDASVGRQVLSNLLCGEGALLRHATRVISTSSQAVMEAADVVLTIGSADGGGGGGSTVTLGLPPSPSAVEGAGVGGGPQLTLRQQQQEERVSAPAPPQQPVLGDSQREPEVVAAPFLGSILSSVLGTGGVLFFALIIILLLSEACWVELSAVILTKWSDDPRGLSYDSALRAISGGTPTGAHVYIQTYLFCILAEFISAYLRQLIYGIGTRRSADSLHNRALGRLARARMAFFDTSSVGSVISVFGIDLSDLDKTTWYATEYFLLGWCYSLVVVITNVAFSSYTLIALLPSAAMLLWRCKRKSPPPPSPMPAPSPHAAPPPEAAGEVELQVGPPEQGSEEGAAACGVTANDPKVPISDHLSRCLEGGAVLRAFPGAAERSVAEHAALLDAYCKATMLNSVEEIGEVKFFNLVGALYYVSTVIIIIPCVLYKSSFDTGGEAKELIYMTPGVAGLLLLNAAFASYMLQMILQNGQTLERLRAPRSRLKWLGDKGGRIAHCEEEEEEEEEEEGGAKSAAAARAPPALAEAQQPSTGNGHLILTDVHLRYAPDLPLVLRGVSLSVPPGKKVAVVGRTGAGKSSLIAAICRLVEVQGGVVALDGRDLRTLHLAEVRAACVVVTQDSLFFQGSLRFNLDPFATYSDAEIQAALNAVGFFKPDAAAAGGQVEGGVAAGAVAAAALESEVGERGAGLSAGQCQLVQLARALLRRPNLLLLDEATASLDEGAEELVLGALRGLRLSCVIIAHRLACAVECDLVCVMGEGRVIECGEPWELLQKEGGAFAALAAAAPNRALIEARAREGRPGGGGMQPVI